MDKVYSVGIGIAQVKIQTQMGYHKVGIELQMTREESQ